MVRLHPPLRTPAKRGQHLTLILYVIVVGMWLTAIVLCTYIFFGNKS